MPQILFLSLRREKAVTYCPVDGVAWYFVFAFKMSCEFKSSTLVCFKLWCWAMKLKCTCVCAPVHTHTPLKVYWEDCSRPSGRDLAGFWGKVKGERSPWRAMDLNSNP